MSILPNMEILNSYQKNMYTFILFPFFLLILIVLMYFIIIRKNEFERRLDFYRLQHQLSQKREAYLIGVHKFRLWGTSILFIIFIVPLLVYFVLMFQEESGMYGAYSTELKGSSLVIFLFDLLCYYLFYYVLKRNEKALRMLVEQMSDTDFESLLKIKSSLFVLTCYNPPFVLCNHRLYIFVFYAIREIDPTKITCMNWSHVKDGMLVTIKESKKILVTIPRGVFSYFLQIVQKYNPKLNNR